MRSVRVLDAAQAYEEISNGNLIWGDRGIGKTRALLRVIHDKHDGNVFVLFQSRELAKDAIRMYGEMFPDSVYFKAVSFRNAFIHGLDGISIPVYADGLDRARPRERAYIVDQVAAIFGITGHELAGCL